MKSVACVLRKAIAKTRSFLVSQFLQANKIAAESEDNEVTFGKVSILIAPKFKLATEAIIGFYTLFPPFPGSLAYSSPFHTLCVCVC